MATDTYLWTTVVAPRDMTAYALTGALKPAKVWLNGEVVTGEHAQTESRRQTRSCCRYAKPGRTYFVVPLTTGAISAGARVQAATGDALVEPTRRAAVRRAAE